MITFRTDEVNKNKTRTKQTNKTKQKQETQKKEIIPNENPAGRLARPLPTPGNDEDAPPLPISP